MQRQLSGVLRPSVAVDTVAIFLSSIGLAALCYQGLARETFGWFDEARHVMNGVFFSDLYRDFPLVSIYQYTVEYFVRFPALSFSWHPPLFAAITGLVLLVGGLEPIYVRLLVFCFAIMGVAFWYLWVRDNWGRVTAIIAALIFVTSPTVCFWAAAIMLEIPVVAVMCGGLLCLGRYLDRPSFSRSVIAGVLVAAMLLMKQTSIFILPAFALYPVLIGKKELLWSRTSLPVHLLVFCAIAALSAHAWVLGSVGIAERLGDLSELAGAPPRFSLERWLLYPRVLLESFGWPTLATALIGCVEVGRRRKSADVIILTWLALWYVAFSITSADHGDALRYTTYVAAPICLLTARSLGILANMSTIIRHAGLLAMIGLIAWNGSRSYAIEWPRVSGFREPARFVQSEAGDMPVLYCCRFDGEFIFQRRRFDPSRHSITLRADKVLVNFSIMPAYGMISFIESRADILEQLDHYGIALLIIESRDNLRISQLDLLRDITDGPEFEFLGKYPISGNFAPMPQDLNLQVYRYRNARAPLNGTISIPAPQLGTALELRLPR